MLAILVRVFFVVFLVWIFPRLLAMFTGNLKAKQAKGVSEDNPNQMVKDPVCGMYMDSRLAVRLERKQEKHYFCSEDCKQKYLNQSSGSPNPNPPA
jgi:YHS domain-containing protein